MLFESKSTCLLNQCPACSGKIFRYVLTGTYQSDEYGTTCGLKLHDRCQECREIFGQTDVAMDSGELSEQVTLLFGAWEARTLTDDDFVHAINRLFVSAGGWIAKSRQGTG